MNQSRFKGLAVWAFLMISVSVVAIFLPMLLPLVVAFVAFAAVFVAGVVVVAADYIVSGLRGQAAGGSEPPR